MPLDPEKNEIGFLLSRTYFEHKKKASQQLGELGITPEQFGILHQLYKHEGISQKTLSKLHGKDQTSIGKTLERLEKKGLIVRKADPVDRRAIVLVLSAGGKELYQQAFPIMEQINQYLNDVITPEGADELIILLNKIYNSLSG